MRMTPIDNIVEEQCQYSQLIVDWADPGVDFLEGRFVIERKNMGTIVPNVAHHIRTTIVNE